VTDLSFPDDAFDATLCLGGALSHVLDSGARDRAAAELGRVTVPGGPVFVSVMGLLGAVQLYLLTGHHLRALPELLETGDHDPELLARYGYEGSFTETHYFRREELVELLSANGLDVRTVTGLEGLASPLHDGTIRERLGDLDDAERAALFETVRRTDDDPAVADLSVHVLAVGRA
jgi:SAM-dependent methyltransferase